MAQQPQIQQGVRQGAIALLLSSSLGLALIIPAARAETPRLHCTSMPEMSSDRSQPLNPSTPPQSLNSATWQLVQMTDTTGNWITPIADTVLTANFDAAQKRLSGSAGCNRYFATYQQDAQDAAQLTVGMAASTRMACAEAVLNQEQAFLQQLSAIRSYQIEGDRLTLYNDQQQPIVRFTAQPTP